VLQPFDSQYHRQRNRCEREPQNQTPVPGAPQDEHTEMVHIVLQDQHGGRLSLRADDRYVKPQQRLEAIERAYLQAVRSRIGLVEDDIGNGSGTLFFVVCVLVDTPPFANLANKLGLRPEKQAWGVRDSALSRQRRYALPLCLPRALGHAPHDFPLAVIILLVIHEHILGFMNSC
jgi:hypothetical protein